MRRALAPVLALAGLVVAGCAGTRVLDTARLPANPHSRLTVATAEGLVEVFLVAEEPKARHLNATYCAGNEGAREVTGLPAGGLLLRVAAGRDRAAHALRRPRGAGATARRVLP